VIVEIELKMYAFLIVFRINYDFVFDDAMATAFNCSVKSFDPR
jgi:hypothetical protein